MSNIIIFNYILGYILYPYNIHVITTQIIIGVVKIKKHCFRPKDIGYNRKRCRMSKGYYAFTYTSKQSFSRILMLLSSLLLPLILCGRVVPPLGSYYDFINARPSLTIPKPPCRRSFPCSPYSLPSTSVWLTPQALLCPVTARPLFHIPPLMADIFLPASRTVHTKPSAMPLFRPRCQMGMELRQ